MEYVTFDFLWSSGWNCCDIAWTLATIDLWSAASIACLLATSNTHCSPYYADVPRVEPDKKSIAFDVCINPWIDIKDICPSWSYTKCWCLITRLSGPLMRGPQDASFKKPRQLKITHVNFSYCVCLDVCKHSWKSICFWNKPRNGINKAYLADLLWCVCRGSFLQCRELLSHAVLCRTQLIKTQEIRISCFIAANLSWSWNKRNTAISFPIALSGE